MGRGVHVSAAMIKSFYDALAKRDGEAMARIYSADARFSDPVFPDLRGVRIGAMWRMLCERSSPDFRVEVDRIESDGTTGSCRWQAWYTFSKTGRPVHNVVTAHFRFENGQIVEHHDSFDLWRWEGMALGSKGRWLGWLPSVKHRVRTEARQGLELYMKRKRIVE